MSLTRASVTAGEAAADSTRAFDWPLSRTLNPNDDDSPNRRKAQGHQGNEGDADG